MCKENQVEDIIIIKIKKVSQHFSHLLFVGVKNRIR